MSGPAADVRVLGSGSVYLLYCDTDTAQEWAASYLPERQPWEGDAWAVEHDYIEDIVGAMIVEAGLTVTLNGRGLTATRNDD